MTRPVGLRLVGLVAVAISVHISAAVALVPELQEAVDGLSATEAEDEQVARHLETLVGHLRAGDYRLARPSPTEVTAERQVELADAGCISGLGLALARADPRVLALGAELTHLLTTNNPKNRAALGAAGVIPHLVKMARAGAEEGARGEAADEVVRGSEEAGEALWILAFSDGPNHEVLAEQGAAAVLADLVLRGASPKARMWAGAAMGNLVAAYGSVPAEASETVRRQLIARPGLIEALVGMALKGPSRAGEESKWPSRAHKDERWADGIVAWGAGQALKNLALSEAAHEPIKQAQGVRALCRLKSSPDWLDKMKGELTLANLGADCQETDL